MPMRVAGKSTSRAGLHHDLGPSAKSRSGLANGRAGLPLAASTLQKLTIWFLLDGCF